MAKEERVFDIRTLERNLKKGIITQEEYDEYLDSLEDTEENAAVIEAEYVEGVLDEDEEDEASGEDAEEEAEDEDDDDGDDEEED